MFPFSELPQQMYATCYDSHLRFPTNVKLLWEDIVWLHRHLCKHYRTLHIQHLRNKYLDVRHAYLAYSRLCKCKKSQPRMITRRLLQLLEYYLISGSASFILWKQACTILWLPKMFLGHTDGPWVREEFIWRQKSIQSYCEYRPALPSSHYQG